MVWGDGVGVGGFVAVAVGVLVRVFDGVAVGAVFVMLNDDVTGAAVAQLTPLLSSPPPCVAVIVQVPLPTMVTVLPSTVHLDGVNDTYPSGNPDVAVPGNVNGSEVPPAT